MRLRSVVNDRPKPMAVVRGKPFIEWILGFLLGQGVGKVILATGYMGDFIEAHLGDGSSLGLEIAYSHEATPLGTGGAVRQALSLVEGGDVLVLNGDSACRFDLGKLTRTKTGASASTALWAVEVEDARRYGSLDIDSTGRVLAFREKSSGIESGFINAGVYLFSRSELEEQAAGRPFSLEKETLPRCVEKGMYAAIGSGPFIDIGTPESYVQADAFFQISDIGE